jgi:hypothetical protein
MLKDFVIQVVPIWICLFDKRYLPKSIPFLYLFLSRDRRVRILVSFEPDERSKIVFLGKAFDQFLAMLGNSLRKVGGHPDVERAPLPVRKNINAELLAHQNGFPLARE